MSPVLRITVIATGLAGCSEGREALTVPVFFEPSEPTVSIDETTSLTITEARITLADLQLFAPADGTATVGQWSPIGTAHAHPGHGTPGDITGELLGTWTLDLLGASIELGGASCWEGETDTASWFLPAEPAATFAGIATVDGNERPFSFTVRPDQPVSGVPFATTLEADQPLMGITLEVDPARILADIDWHALPASDSLTEAEPALANRVIAGLLRPESYQLVPGP